MDSTGTLTKRSRRHGHMQPRTLKRVYKLLKLSEQAVYLRFNGMNAFNTTPYYWFSNHKITTSTSYIPPIWFYDLTAFMNLVNNVVTIDTPLYNLAQNYTTKAWSVAATNGTDSGGTASTLLQLENVPAAAASNSNYPLRSSHQVYSDIRMYMYGCKNFPTKIDVSVVSFPEDEYNPFVDKAWSTGDPKTALMEYLLHPFAFNPIMREDPLQARRIKFHFHDVVNFQPTQNTDNDTAPDQKEYKLFWTHDAIRKYDWNDNDASGATDDASLLQTNNFQVNAGASQTNVRFGLRKYLMLRALTTPTNGTGPALYDATKTPGFDLFVRTRHNVPT